MVCADVKTDAAKKNIRAKPVPAQNPWVRQANSVIHGRGVYARRAIPDGTRVIEYVGELITKAEAERRDLERIERMNTGGDGSVYIFELNKRHDLDGRTTRNVARLINHSCMPNCESETERGHVWIKARRDIAEGEELTFDYGFPYSEWRRHPCLCGTRECPGFIVNKAQRWLVRRALRKERTLARTAAPKSGRK